MRHIPVILFLCLPTLTSAQTARTPEPVPSAAAQMFMQLETDDWILKAEALDYLSRYDVPNVAPAVQKVLDDKSPGNGWLRGQAMIAMTRIAPDKAAALANAHAQDPHAGVRAAVAQVCYDLPKDQATPILEKLLEDKTPSIQFAALAAYARHHGEQAWDRAEPLTADIPEGQIEPAIRVLGWIGSEPALARLNELASTGKQTQEILAGLKGVTNSALAPIYLDLIASSSDSTLPANAWTELQTLEREAVIAACQAALTSGEEKKVQAVARLIAAHLKEPALAESLKTVLAETEDLRTLMLGLSALSCVEADRFSEFFISQLAHDNPQVRVVAVNGLAKCKEMNLYETLEKTLADTDKRVQVAALMALQNAAVEHLPQDRVLEYFTPSLLSPDKETRAAAIASISPHITQENAEAVLAVMQNMQNEYGGDGTKPLMQAIFRMVPEEKAAAILEVYGYVTRWHVVGTFPDGWAAMGDGVDGTKVVYPPEKNVDLKQSFTVVYNFNHHSVRDKRCGKKKAERVIGWEQPALPDADGILRLGKRTLDFPVLDLSSGASYAYTEIVVPRQTEVHMDFLFNEHSHSRMWLNGKELKFSVPTYRAWGKIYTTGHRSGNATLNAGKNRILVKLVAGSIGRSMRLQLTDPKGKPVERSYE